MIDTHAHVLSEYYNVEELISKLKESNVLYVLNASTSLKDVNEIIELSKSTICYYL